MLYVYNRLHADATSSAYSYEYNPCTPFSMSSPGGGGTGCDNVAVIRVLKLN